MRCHSQWIPKAKHILHTLDVCLPITTEVFLLGRDFFTSTAAWCDFLLVFSTSVHECLFSCVLELQVTAGDWRLRAETGPGCSPWWTPSSSKDAGKREKWQVVNRCRKLQQQLLLHAPSIWAILRQQNESLLCMMWHCNASVNRFKCKQKRSSQLDGVDLYMGAPRCWAPSSHRTKVQRSILGQAILCRVSIHVLLVHV